MQEGLLDDLDVLAQRLRPHLKGARRAIVFGSVARGEADDASDLDLVIVADTQRPFLERHRDFAGLWDVWPRLDLLVYTAAELQQIDRFCVTTRYPNGLPGGVPAQVFTRAQAERAVADARRFVESAEALVS